MAQQSFTIISKEGLHARPASELVKLANASASEMSIQYKDQHVNLKSILAVMALGVPANGEITITATGADEAEALQKLETTLAAQGVIA